MRRKLLTILVLVIFLGGCGAIEKDAYTKGFLEDCTPEEIQKASYEKGIKHIPPNTDNDKKLLQLIDILNRPQASSSSLAMQCGELKVNERLMEERVEVLSQKVPGRRFEIKEVDGKKSFALVSDRSNYSIDFLSSCTKEELENPEEYGIRKGNRLIGLQSEDDVIILEVLKTSKSAEHLSYVYLEEKIKDEFTLNMKLRKLEEVLTDKVFSIEEMEIPGKGIKTVINIES